MKTLDLYIGINFTRRFLLVLAILAFLFSFFEFIAQVDDVGKGHYLLKDAIIFVGLTLPGRIIDLIPGSTLLGSVIALGLLSDNNELLAMQAGGISVRRICWSVLVGAALPIVAGGLFAEFVVPPLEQHARTLRLSALADADITFTKSGFWARNGPFFIHVRKTRSGRIPIDVDIFEWDKEKRLRLFTHARKIDVTRDKRWVLTDIEQKVISGEGITPRRMDTLTLESFLSADQMTIQELPPETLSLSDLYRYVRALKERGQNAEQYELVFWEKLSIPLITAAMVLISLTFVFGTTRIITAGSRIMMGSIAGIGLYLLNQIIAQLGLILGLHPAFTTMVPVAAVLCLAFWLLSRGP